MRKNLLERLAPRFSRSTVFGTIWNDLTKTQTNIGVPLERQRGTRGGFRPSFHPFRSILFLRAERGTMFRVLAPVTGRHHLARAPYDRHQIARDRDDARRCRSACACRCWPSEIDGEDSRARRHAISTTARHWRRFCFAYVGYVTARARRCAQRCVCVERDRAEGGRLFLPRGVGFC